MNKLQKIILYPLISTIVSLASVGWYGLFWEKRQPKEQMSGRIKLIEPYQNHNDLHWSSNGYRIFIEGEDRPIDFPRKNWDDTVREGDSVDLIVRRSFFGDELDGLSIDDHK